MKLRPVSAWLIKDRPDLALVEQVPTHERLGIAFALGNDGLRERVNGALAELRDDGTLHELKRAWLD
jgi:ABC-type amino acid transport substrate-binding protein